MNLSEFQNKVERIVEKIKKHDKQGVLNFISVKEPLEFYDGYDRNLKEYRDNIVHSKALFPDRLFKDVAPNQSKEDLDYISSTYQCVTKDVALEFANTVKRAFYNGYIEWPKETETNQSELDSFWSYLNEGIDQYGSLAFFMSMLADEKLNDANAVCAVLPEFELTSTTAIDEDGNEIVEDVISDVNPIPTIYNTERVLHVDNGEFIIESYEKSPVRFNRKEVYIGRIFLLINSTHIAKAVQVGDYVDWTFEFSEWEHGVGTTPALRLAGIPIQEEGKLSFSSPFYTAVPNLNLAALDSATMLVIKRKVGYPTRVFITEACTNIQNGSQCDNGVIRYSNGDEFVTTTCNSCKGTGKIGVFGAQSEILIEKAQDGANQIKASEAMAYVSPSVDVPKFLREEINQYIDRAKEVLHLKAEPRGSGDISATEKNIDVKNTESFIKPISDQLWFIYGKLIEFIGKMKYDDNVYDEIAPKVVRAERFDLIKPEDYLLQIAEARKAGVPEIAIQSLMYNYLQSLNYTDTFSSKVFELIEQSDSLISLSPDQISLGLARNTIQPWEVILHQKGIYLITKLNRESDGNFFELDIAEQIEQLQTAAKNDVGEATIELPPAIEV